VKNATSSLSPRLAAEGRSRSLRVLALVSREELDEFFPADLRAAVPGELRLGDTDRLLPSDLEALFAGYRPEVILAGWSTPRLPEPLPPDLRYVCFLTGSVRRAISRAHLEQGLTLTNWGGSIARTVAEAALMLLLMTLRRAGSWNTAMHVNGAWAARGESGLSLFGRRIGLHGFGHVAREFVRLLIPFGVRLSAYDPHVPPSAFAEFGVQRVEELSALFGEHDGVVIVSALVPETTGVITEALMRLLPVHAVLVNVARGAVVDEAGLLRVAGEGRLQVGLDVYHREPLAADSTLRLLNNVVLLPHMAGPTRDRRRDAGLHALENLRRYAQGEPLSGEIRVEHYDRAT
jgi:phosphoglycerate dehydrogenase-like enzyme